MDKKKNSVESPAEKIPDFNRLKGGKGFFLNLQSMWELNFFSVFRFIND